MMDKRCAFTICSRSYVGMAHVLRDSFLKYNKNYEFYIILADTDNIVFDDCVYAESLLKDYIEKETYQEMAFKYDVTEFCTSLKPFCLKYFLEIGFDLVAYIDPDICFYSSFDELDDLSKSIYITPHILTMSSNYIGDEKEENFLKYGIYNCGFIAFRNTQISMDVLSWWASKLSAKSYADAEWGIYTDQKWVDFIPSFVDAKDLFIIKNFGCNVAPWNFFERKIDYENNMFINRRADNKRENKLVFMHFSGYNYVKLMNGTIEHNCRTLSNYEDISPIVLDYGKLLKIKNTDSFFKYSYLYNFYENGCPILMIHRRLYRKNMELGNIYKNPFAEDSEFFIFLKKKKLIIRSGSDVKSKKNVENLDSKRRLLHYFYKFCLKVLGVRRFAEFLKALQMYSRYEEQLDNL